MNKVKVDALIANDRTAFCENDRGWLDTLADDKLDLLVPVEPAPVTNAAPPAPVVPKTVEEFIGTAPDAFKPLLTNALARENATKAALVKGLLANSRNKFTEEQLNAKGTGELEQLVTLGAVEVSYEGKSGAHTETTPVARRMSAPKFEEKSKAA